MTEVRKDSPAEKPGLHPRNKHRGRYDFDQLIKLSPDLARFVKLNAYNDASIDFADPQAVKALNRALLKQHYDITDWDIPAHYLCPPIPGRADYLHYAADLLANLNNNIIPLGDKVRSLDIGVGANIIYPLIGHREYGWHFVGADIDKIALTNAQQVLNVNDLAEVIKLRLQSAPTSIFKGIVQQNETFDLTMCNPPFHASLNEACEGTERKWQNLERNSGRNVSKRSGKSGTLNKAEILNFGGQAAELYCAGGEEAFVSRMITESTQFANQCLWFTTLISKAASLPSVYRTLKKVDALEVKTIDMAQGQKKSRIVAWTFLNANQQRAWRQGRWQ
ncbi:MAG TPA: 23S rRNA (adenine(1618)-N(6))-methyltransferase RlmF [Methylotenera sp.]|nr:23S rRNA (adenine(1618)-N(6))-methyltransferase RlmF [Methylotenera sp.]